VHDFMMVNPLRATGAAESAIGQAVATLRAAFA
jgi:hypothetical protein